MNLNRFLIAMLTAITAVFLYVLPVNAQQGCCSHHLGIAYCDRNTGRYVCNDGEYSPSCTCWIPPVATPRPTIDLTFPIIKASWNAIPNNDGTFYITVDLKDNNPTQYSAVLSKSRGTDPGNLTDFTSPHFYFNNIKPGRWYLNAKKEISGYWSYVQYWTIDVPDWYLPPPTYAPVYISPTSYNPKPFTKLEENKGIFGFISDFFKMVFDYN